MQKDLDYLSTQNVFIVILVSQFDLNALAVTSTPKILSIIKYAFLNLNSFLRADKNVTN